MPFCPKCGREALVTDRFCMTCGQSLERTAHTLGPASTTTSEPAPAQAPLSPIFGMDTRSAYMFDDEGVVRVGTQLILMVAPIILAITLAGIISTAYDPSSFLSLTVVFALLALPLFDGWRSRRLRKLFGLPRAELAQLRAAVSTPWSMIGQMSIKGMTVTFATDRRWASVLTDEHDLAPLTGKASAALGPRFIQAPDQHGFGLSPAKKFMLLTLVFFAFALLLTVWASVTPFFGGEQARYSTIYNSTEAGIRGAPILQQYGEIFFNNVQVALISLVPGYGFLLNSFASYNTGRVIQVIAIDNNVAPPYLLYILFILPHSWVEELAYPMAEALGIYALFQWRKQSYSQFTNWRTRGSTKLAVGFGAVALVLAIAGALEVSEPELRLTGALLLWVPVLLGGAFVYLRFRSKISAALS